MFSSLSLCQQRTIFCVMAQFFTIMSVLLILAVCKPMISSPSRIPNGRQDRAPYIESSEYSPQSLDDANETRSRKGTDRQQTITEAPNSMKMAENETEDVAVDNKIRSLFLTDSTDPGIYLYNNTAKNEPNFKSYNEVMIGDEPDAQPPLRLSPPSDKEFFKVQRSPDGTLSLVYNDTREITGKRGTQTNQTHDKRLEDSHREGSNNKFQTHNFNGLPLTEETHASLGMDEYPGGDNMTDCLEDDLSKTNKTYCSRVRNYPSEDLKYLLNEFSNLKSFFGEDMIVPETIDQRMGDDPSEEFFCRSRQVVIYPQSGQNVDYEWLYIVNSDEFKQGIRIEECLEPYSACGEHVGLTLPSHYVTSCEQHYIYRTLVGFKSRKDGLYKETFRLPACCKCVLRNKLKLSTNVN